jgi:hypothetical protein
VAAAGLLLLGRIGAHAAYLSDVLPGALVLGLGMSLTVAPLTATALGSLGRRHAGVASGVNNAVARAGGLLAVAVLPLAAGIGHGSLTDPAALAPTYHRALELCALLMLAGAAITAVFIPTRLPDPDAPDGSAA